MGWLARARDGDKVPKVVGSRIMIMMEGCPKAMISGALLDTFYLETEGVRCSVDRDQEQPMGAAGGE